MKDFLPILIGIIWVGYNLYQKNKKKAEAAKPKVRDLYKENNEQAEAPADENPQTGLEQFMETFFGADINAVLKEEKEVPLAYDSVETGYSEIEKREPYQKPIDSYDADIDPEAESVENIDIRATQIKMDAEQYYNADEDTENHRINEPFDLKKAIIYDAVLNRPQW